MDYVWAFCIELMVLSMLLLNNKYVWTYSIELEDFRFSNT
jgi:hypothetical protein